ncbi:MAG: LuxR C-terminal-related transcriptional regulator [Pseudonocardia sp.]|nr:LuxR C-terminal-related transcriptional regulator [Pseudonocardia sp.]
MAIDRRQQLHDVLRFVVFERYFRQRTVLIQGPVGSGRTSLLCALADEVPEEFLVLRATGSRAEKSDDHGVIGQLFANPDLAPGVVGAFDELTAMRAVTPGPDPGNGRCRWALQKLAQELVAATAERPVVILLDDSHLADEASLGDLGVLWRRMATADVAVVVTQLLPAQAEGHPWLSEVAVHPRTRQVRIEPLSEAEIEAMLAARIGRAHARVAAASALAVTGGSPLLASGLATDQPVRSHGAIGSGELLFGAEFARRVVLSVDSVGPSTRSVARALAALHHAVDPPGQAETLSMIARALESDVDDVGFRFGELESAGLISAGRYRAAVAADVVVSDIPAEQRAELFRRLAEIVHFDGGSDESVARLLEGTSEVPREWGVDALWTAALDDMRHDRVETALARLAAAARGTADPARAAAINFLRLRLEWRTNPVAASELLPLSVSAATDGLLGGPEVHQLCWYLAWYGHVDRLRTLVDGSATMRAPDDRRLVDLLVPAVFTPARDSGPAQPDQPTSDDTYVGTGARRSRFSMLVHSMRTGATPGLIADAASPMLASPFLDETFEFHVTALTALLQAERHPEAIAHADALIEDVRERNAPTWLAILLSVRAELHLRSGEVEEAHSVAMTSISTISVNGWGVGLGIPLGTAVLACVAQGRHADAASLLQTPLPPEVFETRFGLAVLRARGICRLELGSTDEAHETFMQCRSLALSWSIEAPTYAPWRMDLARARLLLGDQHGANRLARAHLERCATAGPRVRGLAAQAVAATVPGPERIEGFVEAVDLLRQSGDRYALARALVDLGNAHEEFGNSSAALVAGRRAAVLARSCGAHPLLDDPLVIRSSGGRPGEGAGAGSAFLSDAEQRVAMLAADGHSNKSISTELFITVSTVEQHLTRIYRKLGIVSRSDLRAASFGQPWGRSGQRACGVT